ncbi:MAG: efflux RND transporter permease subunit [Herpetosiphonaceae bacterium]|nr:efflux RND transporter permease subunit [Herpetosiphonaceae bacterium]
MSGAKEELNGNRIADTSIRQPVFIAMIMLLALVIGALAFTTLPVNLLPEISIPTIAITVAYPGAGAESVADLVAKPLEDAINTVNGVKHITSTSSEGITQITVELDTSVVLDKGEQDIRDKVNTVRPQLPLDVRDPVFARFDPNDQPIVSIAVTSDTRSPLELRKLVDNDIAPRLQRAQGVGSVTVSGGQVRQINVQMNLARLKALQILPAQLTHAIQTANTNQSLGTINAGDRDINLRAPSMLQTPADITHIQITGTSYKIGDVATVEDGIADADSYARLDGKDTITISVLKQSGSNTVSVAANTRAALAAVFAQQSDLKYTIPNDQSTSVSESVNSAIEELLIAAVSAMLVVLIFFRDLRNTLVTVAGLPVIMIATFAALKLFGLTINLISLLALSVSVGLVIDDAIVVRENIFRRMEYGETPRLASSRGTAEVALSVLAMSLTVIAVFLPVTFTGGITGIIFKSFGITVASAMAISLVEAFTLAPMLSAYFFKQRVPKASHAAAAANAGGELPEEGHEELGRLARGYGRILAWGLRHRSVIVLLALIVLVASVVVASGLKFSFFATQDNHQLVVGFDLPPGSPLAATNKLAQQAEGVLLKDPGVESVLTAVGGAGQAEHGQLTLLLRSTAQTAVVEGRMRSELGFLPKVVVGRTGFGGGSTSVSSRQLQVSIQTSGTVQDLVPLLQSLQGQAQTIPGLTDIDSTYQPGKPELQFQVDPARSGDLGITNDDLATSVRALINGDKATTLRQNGEDTDVVIRLAPGDRGNVSDIRNISLPTKQGSIPLSSLAHMQLTSGPTSIRRYDRLNQVLIGANVVGRNVAETQRDVTAALKQVALPNNVFVSFTGTTQQQNEGFATLFIAMGLSVLFVYMVLASQFGSFLQPFVIMLAMPFSFIGAFLALRIVGLDLDITGMIGLIMLLGLVTKNSILLVDLTNKLRAAGSAKHAALERACSVRLRPILMTTLALVAGGIPSAIGLGQGSEFRRGLSVAVIGGLLTSTLLTLLVVPIAYSLLDSFTTRFTGLFRRQPKESKAQAPAATGGVAMLQVGDGTPLTVSGDIAQPQMVHE